MPWQPWLGAVPGRGGTSFRVWAPRTSSLEVKIVDGPTARLRADGEGYYAATLEGVRPGARYVYRFPDGRERPDPASLLQPEGVHGPSEVVDLADLAPRSRGPQHPLQRLVFSEIHLGTYSREGTAGGAARHLPELSEAGYTAVEVMPVAAFPGARNWGYDGVDLFAAHPAYGGPAGLARLVDAAHARGLSAFLDVVYNHFGPEGNYLGEFGPYLTSRHRTPWGDAVNYDGPDSGPVRRFVIENALRWVASAGGGFDGLRLDAVHGIVDDSPVHLLRELNDAVQREARETGRAIHVIAESDLNEARLVEPPERGGYGLSAAWADDFHHALHVALTGESSGYYEDFAPPGIEPLDALVSALRSGWHYGGAYSKQRGRKHGTPGAHLSGRRFVVAAQNHDQIGNRARGERLAALTSPGGLRVAAALTALSPALPLFFQGEESTATTGTPRRAARGSSGTGTCSRCAASIPRCRTTAGTRSRRGAKVPRWCCGAGARARRSRSWPSSPRRSARWSFRRGGGARCSIPGRSRTRFPEPGRRGSRVGPRASAAGTPSCWSGPHERASGRSVRRRGRSASQGAHLELPPAGGAARHLGGEADPGARRVRAGGRRRGSLGPVRLRRGRAGGRAPGRPLLLAPGRGADHALARRPLQRPARPPRHARPGGSRAAAHGDRSARHRLAAGDARPGRLARRGRAAGPHRRAGRRGRNARVPPRGAGRVRGRDPRPRPPRAHLRVPRVAARPLRDPRRRGGARGGRPARAAPRGSEGGPAGGAARRAARGRIAVPGPSPARAFGGVRAGHDALPRRRRARQRRRRPRPRVHLRARARRAGPRPRPLHRRRGGARRAGGVRGDAAPDALLPFRGRRARGRRGARGPPARGGCGGPGRHRGRSGVIAAGGSQTASQNVRAGKSVAPPDRRRLAQFGPQPQVAGQAVFVAVLDAAAGDALVAEEGAVGAAQVLDVPLALVACELQVARFDLRRVDPHRAVPLASDHRGHVDHLDGHAPAVQPATVEEQVEALRQRSRPYARRFRLQLLGLRVGGVGAGRLLRGDPLGQLAQRPQQGLGHRDAQRLRDAPDQHLALASARTRCLAWGHLARGLPRRGLAHGPLLRLRHGQLPSTNSACSRRTHSPASARGTRSAMRSGETSTARGATCAARSARDSSSREAPIPLPTIETCASPSSNVTPGMARSASRSTGAPCTFSSGTKASRADGPSNHSSRGQAPCFCSSSASAAPSSARTTSRSGSCATPEMRSSREARGAMRVPGPGANVLRAWMTMPRSRANSTACAFRTFAPARASSCISS